MKIKLLAAALALTGSLQAQERVDTESLKYSTSNSSTISIHDPSVVCRNGKFTIWGSHLGAATSSNLVSWTPVYADGNTFRKLAKQGQSTSTACGFADAFNVQQVTKVKNLKGEDVDFPNFDAEAYCSRYAADKSTWINGDMWAPDIIYNEQMKKWCMYLSLNGDHWSSIIILLTSNTSTGPWTYQGPVVMGGFNSTTHDGVATPKVGETDYEIATGEKAFAARYKQSDNGKFWPNCIDPCTFYDEEGELWMSYGSWSGGIFLLKLDKETGLRDYTYTYPSDYTSAGANGVSDPYFGKKIAGGYYVSGEGSYIQHIGKYYYLFMSYGGFAPDGGYDMRIFRSEKPDGPYVDANGTAATFTSYRLNYGKNANDTRGMKLMSAYNQWGELQEVGETAQGHNSACVDDKGCAYVVYHTKFNDGTAGHQVRVRKLFTNKNGWLVAAPFIHQGESQNDEQNTTSQLLTDTQVLGEYQLMVHPFKQNHSEMEEAKPIKVTLAAGGKVTGDMTGTWSRQEGTNLMSIKLGTTTYNGVFCQNIVSGATKAGHKTSTSVTDGFTAICDTKGNSNVGVPVWGYKMNDESALAYNYRQNTIGVKNGQIVSSNLKLVFPTVQNTTLTWTSSEPAIISEKGLYNPAGLSESTPVTLTARLECGEKYWEQEYSVKAKAETLPTGDYKSGLVAYYSFDEKPTYNLMQTTDQDKITYGHSGSGKTPTLEEDCERMGQVVHQYFGAMGQNSYSRMPNPLFENDTIQGFTLSAWVKPSEENAWDALMSFYSTTVANSDNASRLFLTGNSYVGYNDGTGNWFDLNHPNDGTYTNIPVGEWSLVTLTVGPENGVRIYINGGNKAFKTIAASSTLSGSTTNAKVKSLPIADIVKKIATMKYFNLGTGSFWGSADAQFDDLLIYARELPSTDVTALKTMCNRVYDFSKAGDSETAIEGLAQEEGAKAKGVYDLTGRRYNAMPSQRGLYIMNGKKMVNR